MIGPETHAPASHSFQYMDPTQSLFAMVANTQFSILIRKNFLVFKYIAYVCFRSWSLALVPNAEIADRQCKFVLNTPNSNARADIKTKKTTPTTNEQCCALRRTLYTVLNQMFECRFWLACAHARIRPRNASFDMCCGNICVGCTLKPNRLKNVEVYALAEPMRLYCWIFHCS